MRALDATGGLLRAFLLQRRPTREPAQPLLAARRPAPAKQRYTSKQEEQGVQVLVRDNNVDQALKALKKKMQREGIFREMKLRGHYEKPSTKKAREKAEAIRRARKLARKRAQREGLLPGKPKTATPRAGGPGGRGPGGGRGGFAGGGGGFGGGGGGGFGSRPPR
jgi:small subunit ribosomal protein S21